MSGWDGGTTCSILGVSSGLGGFESEPSEGRVPARGCNGGDVGELPSMNDVILRFVGLGGCIFVPTAVTRSCLRRRIHKKANAAMRGIPNTTAMTAPTIGPTWLGDEEEFVLKRQTDNEIVVDYRNSSQKHAMRATMGFGWAYAGCWVGPLFGTVYNVLPAPRLHVLMYSIAQALVFPPVSSLLIASLYDDPGMRSL